jgi:hypothetical protein
LETNSLRELIARAVIDYETAAKMGRGEDNSSKIIEDQRRRN